MAEDALRLTFLGTGNAFADGGRCWSSFVANDNILFDPSPIALAHMKKLGLAPADIDAVFVSHFHADHWFGLPFLLLEYSEFGRGGRPLTIVGPPGIEEMAREVTRRGYPHVFEKLRFEIEWIEARDGLEGQAAGHAFRPFQVIHAEGMECFGYRVELHGRTLAYSGDTRMCDALVPLAEGADVFVVECSCWDDACGPHLSPNDIRTLRARVAPATSFLLTHVAGGEGPFGRDIAVARDLETYRF